MSKEGQPVGWPEKDFPERPGFAKWGKVVTKSSPFGSIWWDTGVDSPTGF